MKITFSEGSGLNDSVYGKCQAPIRMFLEQRGEQFEQQSVLKNLFLMGTSENYGDLLTTMTAMSGFEPVGENGAYPADGMQEGYSKLIVYDTWKDSFAISAEMIEDAKRGRFDLIVTKEISRFARNTPPAGRGRCSARPCSATP